MRTHIDTTLVLSGEMAGAVVQLSHGYLYSAGKHGSPVNTLLKLPEKVLTIPWMPATVHKKRIEDKR